VLMGAQMAARRLLNFNPAVESDNTPVEADNNAHAYQVEKNNDVAHYENTSATNWSWWGIAGGGGFGLSGFIFIRRWLRNKPRNCERCQQPMVRLSEQADDEHLNHNEKNEEKVGSVDYDIWCCTACPQVIKLRYGTWFTSYARCPKCQAVTKSSNSTTLQEATYSSGGRVRIDEACAACDYRHTFTRSTPQKTRSSSSGSSGGGGGRSSGRGGGGGW
jgi:uncharacterized protein